MKSSLTPTALGPFVIRSAALLTRRTARIVQDNKFKFIFTNCKGAVILKSGILVDNSFYLQITTEIRRSFFPRSDVEAADPVSPSVSWLKLTRRRTQKHPCTEDNGRCRYSFSRLSTPSPSTLKLPP